jgi:flagellar protein FlgJ
MDPVMPISSADRMLRSDFQSTRAGIGKLEGSAFIDIFRDMLGADNAENRIREAGHSGSNHHSAVSRGRIGTVSKDKTENPDGRKKAEKPVDEKLLSACRDMEALFTGIMLKSMRKTIHESGFFGKSLAKDIYSDMLYDEYAKLMAKTDQIGLARQIYDQLSE